MSNERKYILGCDIGNGYGYISVLQDSEADPRPLLPVRGGLAKIGMPTAAYVVPPDGDEIEVFRNGKPAEIKYKRKTGQLIRAVKTRFKEGSIAVPGISRPVDAGRIYAAAARDLILLAEDVLPTLNMEPIYDVVFTFPASFSDDSALLDMMQRNIESIEINGERIHVSGRLPEPAAVAIDYLHYMQHAAPEDVRIDSNRYTVLVYDLGHGTFDTAVVTAESDGVPYKLHSKAGLAEVGGKNFDQILYDEILRELQEQHGFAPHNDTQRENIRRAAVDAKIALSDREAHTVSVMNDDGAYCEVDITRERFEELSQHLIFQTLELVQSVLDEAASNGIEIDGIVLSGGASQMPMVKNNLEELAEGAFPISLYRPSEAVSFGAARFAYGIPQSADDGSSAPGSDNEKGRKAAPQTASEKKPANRIIEQLTDCCYGIWMPAEGKLEGEIRFVIQPGKSRPAVSEAVSLRSESERVVIKVYRSKEKNKAMEAASADDCESMLWIPFNVQPGAVCEVTVTALENYDIQVDLVSDKGDRYSKRTSDVLKNII